MKAIPDSVMLFRLAGMLIACWAVPVVLCYYVGPAVGALGAVGAAVLWYSQYRLPTRTESKAASFWFVAVGYAVIGITLMVCLARLIGVSL